MCYFPCRGAEYTVFAHPFGIQKSLYFDKHLHLHTVTAVIAISMFYCFHLSLAVIEARLSAQEKSAKKSQKQIEI